MYKQGNFSFKSFKKKHQKFFRILRIILWGDTVSQKIAHFYLYLILIGAILLYLPISLTSYPDYYSKIISEDYINPVIGYNATIPIPAGTDFSTITKDNWMNLGNENGIIYYLIRDPLTNYLKIIGTQKYTFWDAIFVASSAFSDTGLTTVVLRSTYTVFGQVVIAVLIQIGGIGFIVISYLLWKIFKSRRDDQSAFSKAIILQAERGNSKLGGTAKTIIVASIFIIVSEAIYAIFYALYFNFVPAYEQQVLGNNIAGHSDSLGYETSLITINNTNDPIYVYQSAYSIWSGIFNSIAAMNNAGFDILGSVSLAAYRNDTHAVFLFITMSEFFIGGIGYPVIFDIYERFKFKKQVGKYHKYRFSLFTKISLITTLVVSVMGFVISTSVEMTSPTGSFDIINQIAQNSDPLNAQKTIDLVNNLNGNTSGIYHAVYGNSPTFNATWGMFFETMSTRSAGYSTISNYLYNDASKGILLALMFIGAAPSSTAGGIRTTTFAVICATIWSKLRGRKEVKMFRKTISPKTISDSFVCAFLIIILLPLSSIITQAIIDSSVADNHLSLLDIMYEFASAFGTVGLSTGVSPILTSIIPIPLILAILLMIIGQLGVSTTLLTWVKKNPSGNLYSYPTEEIKIG